MDNAERTPVIIGVGQINDRPDNPLDGLDPVSLMADALRAAEANAGVAPGTLLTRADTLSVVQQIGFPDLADTSAPLAEAIGATSARLFQTKGPNGESPVMLLHEAANAIGGGSVQIALVAGAEALRTAAARAAADASVRVDATRNAAQRRAPGYAERYGLVAPTDVYPLYENALRAALGQTLAEAQSESAAIWSRMSDVAADNPHAWLRKPTDAQTIATPSAANRMIAFPYTKFMVANAAVNQGAAFIVTSVAQARRLGVPDTRMVHIGYGAAAREPSQILARDTFTHSASMMASITAAMQRNGVDATGLDCVELYSCFPCIPKLARRIVGWPTDRPVSVIGGLTFAGGPIGNYMSHAIAGMVERLRKTRGKGLLFANGGYATYNHNIVLSGAPLPDVAFPHEASVQDVADAARGPVPQVDERYVGPATLETFTVLFGRDGQARQGIVVAGTPDGSRTLVAVPADDTDTLSALMTMDGQPVGREGVVEVGDGDALARWRFARR